MPRICFTAVIILIMATVSTARPARKLMSVAKAAAYCDVTTRTIYNWISSGKLAAYRTGPVLLRVDQADLDRMIRPVPAAARDAS